MIFRNKSASQKGIELSGSCCVVCGWGNRNYKGQLLVEGAHVRGMRKTTDYDTFDNIISLCPNHHVEFDVGNITIDPIQKVCFHVDKKDQYHNKELIGRVDHIQPGNFSYHLEHVFKG